MVSVHELVLKHIEPDYDPVEAREYYLRNRELKGRKKKEWTITDTPSSKAVDKAGHKHDKTHKHDQKTSGKGSGPKPKSAAQKKKEVEAQVAGLKGRLEALRKVLALLTKQAKARSGVETPDEDVPESKGASKPTGKPKGKQKADAAKKSKDYYEENKEIDTDSALKTKDLEKKIEEVQGRIEDMKAKLAEAREKATTRKSSSVGARATTNK